MLDLLLLPLLCAPTPVPDVIAPGRHGVKHEMVVEPSEALGGGTLVCWVASGIGGPDSTVVPGEPFRFSSKYDSRLYLLPEGVDPSEVTRPTASAPLDYPSAPPPRGEIHDLPNANPVHAALTTIRLRGVDGDRLDFEVVDHVLFDASGTPVGESRQAFVWAMILAVGLAAGASLLSRRKRREATS